MSGSVEFFTLSTMLFIFASSTPSAMSFRGGCSLRSQNTSSKSDSNASTTESTTAS
ncbi:hypothetical protein PF005_g22101 [Phytophthora fragariae]|uniref:RxLR effector protein n=1 Tax=Phytophthora fragariae TaxID=53985 RepID=A0A6A4CFV0_9STRA|nr:hypothetical protein PF003_g368 [Phytophthora fragariae]KAE9081544.1 hypothetical protein PF007_g22619 [Phytophthora fragariae]KAE9106839.1 hypothetical protein PF006_g21263 [Phytophthora fragariae]KAE9183418.1 hypothetical protein PF005_g22101 [Phytophthora fragariae]KAE9210469.1 hypothetical protein PF004_g16186 [Phytophthora fragariae]